MAAAGVLADIGAFSTGVATGDGFFASSSEALPPSTSPPEPSLRPLPSTEITPVALPPHFFSPTITRIPLPRGTLTSLPSKGHLVALTVDDGASSEVVALYAEFARRTGMRITFFLNGSRPSWTDNAAALRPLVNSGQVQLANHTWSHPNLKKLRDAEIASELSRNEDFIRKTYGHSAKPYFRPPFGFHDTRVDGVAAGLGYSTPVMWLGSLSDSALITETQLKGFANRWMLPQHIVIGHANFPTVTHCFDYLAELIRQRELVPVTLNDVFLS